MFGHDDDQNQQQNNLPDPMPDPNGVVPADSLGGPVTSAMDEASSFIPVPAPTVPDIPVSAGVATPAYPSAAPVLSSDGSDLLTLKQQALQQLSPLMDHLEQTPEEKFRTTMMMIQAADNQALIKTAYDAALAIPDEKARAQALLDVVNEINYFTQQHDTAA